MCTFTVFRLGRTAPHFRPNEGAGGGKAGYIRDLNSLRRVYPPIWRPAAGVGVRWPTRWLHWGLAALVSGFTLLWPKNHRVYPLLAVALFIFPVQLTTSRIGNLARLIHTLLYVMTIHTYIQQSMDQPGNVANPARGQLSRENEYSPVPVRA